MFYILKGVINPMRRHRLLRGFLGLDYALMLHRLLATVCFAAGFVHAFLWVAVNYPRLMNEGRLRDTFCDGPCELVNVPGPSYWYGTYAAKSGFVLAIVSALYVCWMLASAMARKHAPKMRIARYKWFLLGHNIFAVAFIVLLLVHPLPGLFYNGKNTTWVFLALPLLLWLLSYAKRASVPLWRHPVQLLSVRMLPGPWLAIKMTKPVTMVTGRVFDYHPGQHAHICAPIVSLLEWHPFTIASAPEDDHLTFYIKVGGKWTSKLYRRLQQLVGGGAAVPGPDVTPTKAAEAKADDAHTTHTGAAAGRVCSQQGAPPALGPMLTVVRSSRETTCTTADPCTPCVPCIVAIQSTLHAQPFACADTRTARVCVQKLSGMKEGLEVDSIAEDAVGEGKAQLLSPQLSPQRSQRHNPFNQDSPFDFHRIAKVHSQVAPRAPMLARQPTLDVEVVDDDGDVSHTYVIGEMRDAARAGSLARHLSRRMSTRASTARRGLGRALTRMSMPRRDPRGRTADFSDCEGSDEDGFEGFETQACAVAPGGQAGLGTQHSDTPASAVLPPAATMQPERTQVPLEVWVEGPFGSPLQDPLKRRAYNNVVYCAGGVGVTPFLSLLKSQAYLRRLPQHMTGRISLVWAERNPQTPRHAQDVWDAVSGSALKDRIACHVYLTCVRDPSPCQEVWLRVAQALGSKYWDMDPITGVRGGAVQLHFGRPEWVSVLRSISNNTPAGSALVMFCGNKQVGRALRAACLDASGFWGLPMLPFWMRRVVLKLLGRKSAKSEFHYLEEHIG
jgi:predicted ferric reductase